MKGVLTAIALLAGSGLPALAGTSKDMDCSHYVAMNKANQMAAVDSMRSRMPTAHEMASSHEMAEKVAARCKERPGMMLPEAMKKAMPQ